MKSIFLIDDDPIFVYLTRRIIASIDRQCRIDEFADGDLAIRYLQKIHEKTELLPDIIFMDISMPVMDGWEFLNEYSVLKPKIEKDIALFIVSSSISPQEVERSKTYSAVSDFLIKPLERGKIVEIIDNARETAL
ncbi:MAG TPA: response regulator [Puia sp.]|nr:response regulator [Puia sp.]